MGVSGRIGYDTYHIHIRFSITDIVTNTDIVRKGKIISISAADDADTDLDRIGYIRAHLHPYP